MAGRDLRREARVDAAPASVDSVRQRSAHAALLVRLFLKISWWRAAFYFMPDLRNTAYLPAGAADELIINDCIP